jgi:SAM-dependent methyltransferase
MLNVIDHTENPKKVLEQCYRILRPGGILVISVDTYLWFWKIFRKISPLFGHKFYLCHPQTFTNTDVKNLIVRTGFKISHSFIEDQPKFDSRKLRLLAKLKYNIHRLYVLAQK